MVLLLAIKDHASDIHFEPFEDEFRIRIKADGVLYEMVPPPRHLAFAITTRIKVMANLDIAERRMPQDGRIELTVGGNPVDLARQRAAHHVRRERRHARARSLGRRRSTWTRSAWTRTRSSQFRELIHKPNGIILVTGPTGSGKTTTLYSALNELNEIDRQDHHHRRPRRVRHRRHHPGARSTPNRRHVRRLPAGHPAARPRHHPGRRDPRPGNGRFLFAIGYKTGRSSFAGCAAAASRRPLSRCFWR